jgi:hypothetical protein
MAVRETDSWLLQLSVFLTAIGTSKPTADFSSNDWACGIGLRCPSVYLYFKKSIICNFKSQLKNLNKIFTRVLKESYKRLVRI